MSNPISKEEPILKVEGLKMHFPVKGAVLYRQTGSVKAVDGVDLSIRHGRLSAWSANRLRKVDPRKVHRPLLKPTAGRVLFKGTDLTDMSQSSLRPYRQDFQMVFQDRRNPSCTRMSVGELIPTHGHSEDRDRRQGPSGRGTSRIGRSSQKRRQSFLSSFRAVSVSVAYGPCSQPGSFGLDEPVSALGLRFKVRSSTCSWICKRIGVELFVHRSRLGRGQACVRRHRRHVLGQIVESAPAEELYATRFTPTPGSDLGDSGPGQVSTESGLSFPEGPLDRSAARFWSSGRLRYQANADQLHLNSRRADSLGFRLSLLRNFVRVLVGKLRFGKRLAG